MKIDEEIAVVLASSLISVMPDADPVPDTSVEGFAIEDRRVVPPAKEVPVSNMTSRFSVEPSVSTIGDAEKSSIRVPLSAVNGEFVLLRILFLNLLNLY